MGNEASPSTGNAADLDRGQFSLRKLEITVRVGEVVGSSLQFERGQT